MEDYEQAVFISYAWGGESEEIANQIDQVLQKRGLNIVRDKRYLRFKGSVKEFMERIGQGNCVIVVISDKYLRSPNCMFELVEIAEKKEFYDRVFPIVLSNAEIYDPVKQLKYVKYWEAKVAELDGAMRKVGQANLQGIRDEIDLYTRIRANIAELTTILKDMNTLTPDMHRDSDFSEIYVGITRRMTREPSLLETGEPPYMGLRYFDTSDADLFFGREVLTRELLARVQKEPFLAIVGASGSGKSSVARAGLIPAWKAATNGAVHVITPTAHPLESLAVSLTRDSESVTATSTLMDDMQKDARSLRLYTRKLLNASEESSLLLVVDQFEETFTQCKDINERKAFIENLLFLVGVEDGTTRSVITLRADFYHHCAEYESLRVALEKHQAYMGAMTSDELRKAIMQPAETNGWDFQPGLVELILSDVEGEPGALPLLSHALLETWKRRQVRTLTLQGYHEAGGVKKAIAQTAESVYDHLSPTEKEIARCIFLRLTELGEGVQDTRRRIKLEELAQAKEKEAVAKVLKTLADARLVTTEHDSAEVAHEALIREWRTLRKWLDEDRESLRVHRHLTESAEEWNRRGREAGELYRGARLGQIQAWAKKHGDELSPLESKFLKASQNVKKRERMGRFTMAGVGVMLIAVIVLAMTRKFDRLVYRPEDVMPVDNWVTIPAGEFQMGSENGDSNEIPVHPVYVDEFQIWKYEITNKQFNQCIRSGVCTGNLVTAKLDHPVVNVNWYDAETFCEWAGGRLSAEAEWEKAARGTDKRTYPWGENIDCSLANYFGKDNGNDYCVGDTTPVGSYESGKSPHAVYDMAGNVWEWTNSLYKAYPYNAKDGREDLNAFGYRVLRGGAWDFSVSYVRSTGRYWLDPTSSYYSVGFRCVRSLP